MQYELLDFRGQINHPRPLVIVWKWGREMTPVKTYTFRADQYAEALSMVDRLNRPAEGELHEAA